jgi:hypothetical protein
MDGAWRLARGGAAGTFLEMGRGLDGNEARRVARNWNLSLKPGSGFVSCLRVFVADHV